MPSVSQPASSPASSSLLSLHEDILLEILAHLLLDTARAPHKTAILQTCTLLHELGLPLLYKVVDLGGLLTRSRIVDCWTDLFGKGGLLTQDGRIQDLRRNVVKLRIGGPKNQGATNALEGDVQRLCPEKAMRELRFELSLLKSRSRLRTCQSPPLQVPHP